MGSQSGRHESEDIVLSLRKRKERGLRPRVKQRDMIKNEVAGNMNIAAIGAAQATVNNKLADSAKIARNASTIIMLTDKTQEEIEADGVECGNKKMIVTVNRNGMQHSTGEYIDLVFDGNKISYEQAKKQHIPNEPY